MTIEGNTSVSPSGSLMVLPSSTDLRVAMIASSTIELPAVFAVMVRPSRIGTPDEVRVESVRQKVHQGVPIAQPLIENPVFPPMVSQMVKIGEETGELEKMLSKIADFYEDEVDAAIQSLTSIIEPIMMIGVGFMVGIIIVAMYLPMFKMMQLISNSG